ncbi:MAG: branched-chain amino acid ABC transporter permease [Candidatus Aenigmarchaeota archaeon]|nr:branched-chain amino acid ABC transporter permease [Candidatus Aenigmarchaeota archaeon]
MLQILVNGLIAASVYTLVGIGFSLIYGVTRFFHFAHGVVFASGAYVTFFFKAFLGLPLPTSIFLGILLSSLLGCFMEICIYRPFRRTNASASPLVLLLASLGLYVLLQNLLSLFFGDHIKSIRSVDIAKTIDLIGTRITSIQILTICTCVISFATIILVLKKSTIGRALRAVANDSELASISGIDSDRVILSTFALGSALAGIAGILVALDVDMTPTMGMNALMMGVVAFIVGGSIPGVALGALLLGMAQHLGVWYISSQWQDAIAFIILLIFLLFRPQGFLGKKIKKANI